MPVELAATEYGAGPPLAVLHGLLGSGRNWAGIARRLAERHRVVAVDLRNHGHSPWAATMSYPEMAADVRAAMAARGHHRFAVLGHSMGGKVAMVMALSEPAAVERLVVVDIAPVRYPETPLAVVRALRRLELDRIERRRDADAALAETIPDPAERAFLLQNLVLDGTSVWWRPNLAAIEGAMPTLSGFPAFAADFTGPALLVAGSRSDHVDAAAEAALRAAFPNVSVARIADAGHWPHADQPDRFFAAIAAFLAA